jgi:hypothetical protein
MGKEKSSFRHLSDGCRGLDGQLGRILFNREGMPTENNPIQEFNEGQQEGLGQLY